MREAIEKVIAEIIETVERIESKENASDLSEYGLGQNMGMKVAYSHVILSLREVVEHGSQIRSEENNN